MIARIATLALLATMAACATSSDGGNEKKADDRCLTVNQVNLDAISGTLEDGAKATKGAAVKSKDYDNVFMIAAKFNGQVGVWATNDDPTDGTIEGVLMAGDSFAREFSSAAEGKVVNGSDGMAQAKKCLD